MILVSVVDIGISVDNNIRYKCQIRFSVSSNFHKGHSQHVYRICWPGKSSGAVASCALLICGIKISVFIPISLTLKEPHQLDLSGYLCTLFFRHVMELF